MAKKTTKKGARKVSKKPKRKTGAKIEVVPSDKSGQLSVEALREMMDERVRLVSVTHVPTNGGLVNPAEEIGAVTRETGCLYLLDACPSAGPAEAADCGRLRRRRGE